MYENLEERGCFLIFFFKIAIGLFGIFLVGREERLGVGYKFKKILNFIYFLVFFIILFMYYLIYVFDE